jgi:hypothetical protein
MFRYTMGKLDDNHNVREFLGQICKSFTVLVLARVKGVLSPMPGTDRYKKMTTIIHHFFMRFYDVQPALIRERNFIPKAIRHPLPSHVSFSPLPSSLIRTPQV